MDNLPTTMTTLDRAEAYERLKADPATGDLSTLKAAKRLKVTPQTIYNYDLLIASPRELRQDVRKGALSASTVITLMRDLGPALALSRVREAKRLGAGEPRRGKARGVILSGREMERFLKRKSLGEPTKPKPRVEAQELVPVTSEALLMDILDAVSKLEALLVRGK